MPSTRTHRGPALAAALVLLMPAAPALAFQVGQSPDFKFCNIWFNDQGQPLRNKLGREIGEQSPCPGQPAGRSSYRVTQGPTRDTLVIQDDVQKAECVLSLVPGSRTVMVPTSCKALGS